MGKFKAEICREKIPALWPLKERIWILSQSLQKGEKIGKNSIEINLLQKDTSNLPFVNIILSAKGQNKEDGILLATRQAGANTSPAQPHRSWPLAQSGGSR